MYKASKFRIRPLEEIEGIIERGAEALPFIRRIFLADGDALVLPTDTLIAIMENATKNSRSSPVSAPMPRRPT